MSEPLLRVEGLEVVYRVQGRRLPAVTDLSFDVGLRHALTNGQAVNELRAGLTFAFPANFLGAKSR